MIPTPVAWAAGVDYLRLTHRRGTDDQYVLNSYIAAAERAAAYACPHGVGAEPWKWMGYKGNRLGPCAWGEHDQGYILQGSGLGALALSDIRVAYTNVPRIDIQATFWHERYEPSIARNVGEMAIENRPKVRGRPYGVRTIDGHGDGDTCYVGKRGKKSKFLRIYDKWREDGGSSDYRFAWRFEAELTDEHARLCWGSVQDLGRSDEAVYSLLLGYLGERGIAMPELSGARLVPPESLPKDEGSNERRLRWLATQVKPTIDKLLANGVGADEVVRALGLTREHVLLGYLHG